jgi:hypothetical protein|tara:strand:+ start:1982 stop:2392 length:411 start_codon:yes stop_codon:yes gene_type:complete
MRQRVNIQYSIDLEELPWEVNSLISRASTKLVKESNALSDIHQRGAESLLTLKAVEDISLLRQRLANIDFILEDTTNIISGYIGHVTKNNSQQELTQTAQTPQLDKASMENLQGMIEQFKQQIATPSETDEVSDKG